MKGEDSDYLVGIVAKMDALMCFVFASFCPLQMKISTLLQGMHFDICHLRRDNPSAPTIWGTWES